jgi:hypothetical protein
MRLYTLISIALGVFGGTYSALAALRTHFEALVKESRDSGKLHFRKIEERYGENDDVTKCSKEQRSKIDSSATIWNWANTIPAILFALFVFLIAGWVLADWDTICSESDTAVIDRTKFPWPWFYWGLLILVVADFLCFTLAAWAWFRCKSNSKALREKHDLVRTEENRRIIVPSPPVPTAPVNPV